MFPGVPLFLKSPGWTLTGTWSSRLCYGWLSTQPVF